MDVAAVTVELFGVARQRAGRPELAVTGHTVAEVVRGVSRLCPGLAGIITGDGRVSRQYLLCVDGGPFIEDPGFVIPPGGRLLILGADAGG